MAKEFSETEVNKVLFVNLVMMFSTTAMQQLGKLVNPATRQAEIDLESAQTSIDILTMLAAKTKGNLDNEEVRMLKEAISTLQVNYVETAESALKKDGASQAATSARPGEDGGAAPKQEPDGPDAGEAKKRAPKFHMSYGEG
jgi:Domain of unknown function (DUF1844)